MAPPSPSVVLEFRPLASFQPASRNPRQHDLGAIHESIEVNGYIAPVIVDAATGRLVAGHGRIVALRQRQKDGKPLPALLRAENGDWMVPCHVVPFKDVEAAERYLLADNRTTERADYDCAMLATILDELRTSPLALTGTGFDVDDLHKLLKDLGDQENGSDEVPPLPRDAVTKSGDLWTLGDHRLLCGDSTLASDVLRVCAGERAALMVTDPPYGVAYTGGAGNEEEREAMQGDESADLYARFLPLALKVISPNAAVYLWHAAREGEPVYRACRENRLTVRSLIVWRKMKPHFGAYMAQYKQDHEPCLYCVRTEPPKWYGDTNERAVWEIDQPTKNEHHPTQKPVQLFEIPIQNHTKPGEWLYEPFSGSGTQIIAAEKTERRCAAIEIEPKYVDCAIERWENLTKGKAVRSTV